MPFIVLTGILDPALLAEYGVLCDVLHVQTVSDQEVGK